MEQELNSEVLASGLSARLHVWWKWCYHALYRCAEQTSGERSPRHLVQALVWERMPMKRLTICERDWNFNTVVFVSVNKTSGDGVVPCNIHVYGPVICPAHGGVCVSNPWPDPGLSLYK